MKNNEIITDDISVETDKGSQENQEVSFFRKYFKKIVGIIGIAAASGIILSSCNENEEENQSGKKPKWKTIEVQKKVNIEDVKGLKEILDKLQEVEKTKLNEKRKEVKYKNIIDNYIQKFDNESVNNWESRMKDFYSLSEKDDINGSGFFEINESIIKKHVNKDEFSKQIKFYRLIDTIKEDTDKKKTFDLFKRHNIKTNQVANYNNKRIKVDKDNSDCIIENKNKFNIYISSPPAFERSDGVYRAGFDHYVNLTEAYYDACKNRCNDIKFIKTLDSNYWFSQNIKINNGKIDKLFLSGIENFKYEDLPNTKTLIVFFAPKLKKIENLPKSIKELFIFKSNISKIENLPIQLESLGLSGSKIKKIENLGHLSNLKYLDLSESKIKKIENLKQLKNLEELDLSETNISKIENLNQKLKILDLSRTNVSKIENLPTTLKDFNLIKTYVTKKENLPSGTECDINPKKRPTKRKSTEEEMGIGYF